MIAGIAAVNAPPTPVTTPYKPESPPKSNF